MPHHRALMTWRIDQIGWISLQTLSDATYRYLRSSGSLRARSLPRKSPMTVARLHRISGQQIFAKTLSRPGRLHRLLPHPR